MFSCSNKTCANRLLRKEMRRTYRFGLFLCKQGQATLEAAYLIPVLFILLLLLIQPTILLYNHLVMHNAAALGCRALITKSDVMGTEGEAVENFIRRRLSSIPQENHFHVHDQDCSYEITCEGSESSAEVRVVIRNEAEPLPLLGLGANLLGVTNERGNFDQVVEVTLPTTSSWVQENDLGLNPKSWVHQER